MDTRETVVSGIRATGTLHLGNYLGAIRQFVEMQERYNCFFFVADWHSLTTEKDSGKIRSCLLPIVIDYLAMGLDPAKCTIFVQSNVPEIAELSLLLSMVQPKAELESLPTYLEKVKGQEEKGEFVTAGLFYYPIMMAADILIQKAHVVPAGKDQQAHIFLARDLAKRFNTRFGETFPIPNMLEGEPIRVPGLDGKEKMGKSDGNTVNLVDDPKTIEKKIAQAMTDPNRKRRQDPGNPAVCNIFALHQLLSQPNIIQWAEQGCKSAGIGCLECKKALSGKIVDMLGPFREKRLQIAADPGYVEEVLRWGAKKARVTAQQTMEEVRGKMGLRNFSTKGV